MNRFRIPMNIQLFADPAPGGDPGTGSQPPQGQQSQKQDPAGGGGQQAVQIDYSKIQQMLDGTLAVKEDTALKAYFKQQGLSQQEAEQAIADFKAQKAASQPDVGVMQEELAQTKEALLQEQVKSAAAMAAFGLGIDAKTIPYVLKMSDLGSVVGQDGKINEETLKNALNKVLEDVPALKPQAQQVKGFQIGAPGNGSQQTTAVDEELDRIFGVKKK